MGRASWSRALVAVGVAGLLLAGCGSSATTGGGTTRGGTPGAAATGGTTAGGATTGGTQPSASAPPAQITIGTLYAGSGSYATSSQAQLAGLKFWAAEVNKAGGVEVKAFGHKIPVKVVAYNDQSDTTTAQTLYTQLITQDKVDVLVADFGSVLTSVAVPIAQEHKMVLFDPTGTGASFFTPNNPYIVLTSLPSSGVWPTTLAEYLLEQHVAKIAVLYATNDFDQSQEQTLVSQLKQHGVTPVYDHGVDTSTSNYSVLVHDIAATNPDAVIEFGYDTNDIAFLQTLASTGAHFPFVFTIFPGQELQLLQRNVGVAGLQYTYTYPTPPLVAYNKVDYGMGIDQFTQAFQTATGQAPDFLDVAGYTAGLVVQKSLETAPSLTQSDLRAAAGDISMTTLDGQFKIDTTGAQIGENLPVGQLQPSGSGLKLVVVYPPSVATGKAVYPAPAH
jgi:branched-chain amino acid transport system substrate-binding protein